MKKLLSVSLAVLVLGSLALVAFACGEEEEATTTTRVIAETTVPEVTSTTEPAPSALTPAEVKELPEGTMGVTFAGPVLAIDEKPDKYIIRIGTEEASFPCAVYKEGIEAFGGIDTLNLMIGRTVEITGDIVLNPFGSATEIVLTDAAQVVLR